MPPAPSNPPIRAVLLDAVGTLIYPDPPVAQAYYEAGRRHGSQLTPAEIEPRFRQALADHLDQSPTSETRERQRWRQIVAHVFDDVPKAGVALFDQLWDHFASARHWKLFADAAPAWAALESAGVQLCVASNFDQRLIGICASKPPLDRAAAVFVSAEVGYGKPSREFFGRVQQRLGLPGAVMLMVGDNHEHDVLAAQAAGWRALRIDRGGTSGDQTAIRSLEEIVGRL